MRRRTRGTGSGEQQATRCATLQTTSQRRWKRSRATKRPGAPLVDSRRSLANWRAYLNRHRPEKEAARSGKGVKLGEGNGDAKGGGKGPPADIDRNDQSAQHKWARRSTRRGRDEDEAQVGMGRASGGDEMEVVEGGTQRDEAGSGAADAASWEKKRQMVLDKIKGRLQQEKNRKATELQAKAIAEGAMPEPHMLTKEQMDECQRRMEATNREVDEEAEKELAAMSKEQISKLVEG